MSIPIGILVVSDRAARGEYEDRSGPAVEVWLQSALTVDWTAQLAVVPDEADAIRPAALHRYARVPPRVDHRWHGAGTAGHHPGGHHGRV